MVMTIFTSLFFSKVLGRAIPALHYRVTYRSLDNKYKSVISENNTVLDSKQLTHTQYEPLGLLENAV